VSEASGEPRTVSASRAVSVFALVALAAALVSIPFWIASDSRPVLGPLITSAFAFGFSAFFAVALQPFLNYRLPNTVPPGRVWTLIIACVIGFFLVTRDFWPLHLLAVIGLMHVLDMLELLPSALQKRSAERVKPVSSDS